MSDLITSMYIIILLMLIHQLLCSSIVSANLWSHINDSHKSECTGCLYWTSYFCGWMSALASFRDINVSVYEFHTMCQTGAIVASGVALLSPSLWQSVVEWVSSQSDILTLLYSLRTYTYKYDVTHCLQFQNYILSYLVVSINLEYRRIITCMYMYVVLDSIASPTRSYYLVPVPIYTQQLL